MNLAVFDVCGTLYRSNTSFDFHRFLRRDQKRYALLHQFVCSRAGKAVGAMVARTTGYPIYRDLFSRSLRGRLVSDIEQAAQEFVEQFLSDKTIPETHDLLTSLKESGFQIVLMSASYDFVVSAVATKLQVDDYIASAIKTTGDRFASGYQFDTQGRKHAILAERYENVQQLVAVSDNLTDLELLKTADEAYAIIHKQKHESFWDTNLPGGKKLMVGK